MGDVSLLRRAATGLIASGIVSHVVVTAPAEEVGRFHTELVGLPDGSVRTSTGRHPGIETVAGSSRFRQASVALGFAASLTAIPQANVVIIHDVARALTLPEVTQRVVATVRAGHEVVVPALPMTSTAKEIGAHPTGKPEPIVDALRRDRLRAVQTPQGFLTPILVAAHRVGVERIGDEALAASSDAGFVEVCGGSAVVVAGDEHVMKVTAPMDLALAELLLERQSVRGERPAEAGGEN